MQHCFYNARSVRQLLWQLGSLVPSLCLSELFEGDIAIISCYAALQVSGAHFQQPRYPAAAAFGRQALCICGPYLAQGETKALRKI